MQANSAGTEGASGTSIAIGRASCTTVGGENQDQSDNAQAKETPSVVAAPDILEQIGYEIHTCAPFMRTYGTHT